MIAVVWGHAVILEIDANKSFAAFRMPFFFIMAGFLLNLDKWSDKNNYKAFRTKLINRLLIPYYAAEILIHPFWFIFCHELGLFKYLGNLTIREPIESFLAVFIGNDDHFLLILVQLWFLTVLFFAEIIFIKLYKAFSPKIFLLAVIITAGVGFYLKDIMLPLGIDIALVSQIFLLTGVLIRRYEVVEKIDLKICVVLALILIGAVCFNEHIDMNARIYGNVWLFYSGAIAGTLLVIKISTLIARGKIFSLISECGKESMTILIWHPIIASIFYEILARTTTLTPEEFFTNPIIIFCATTLGTLIPLFMAKKF